MNLVLVCLCVCLLAFLLVCYYLYCCGKNTDLIVGALDSGSNSLVQAMAGLTVCSSVRHSLSSMIDTGKMHLCTRSEVYY